MAVPEAPGSKTTCSCGSCSGCPCKRWEQWGPKLGERAGAAEHPSGSVSLSNEQRKTSSGQQRHLRPDPQTSSCMRLARWLWLCSCCWPVCITDKPCAATTRASLSPYKSCPASLWPDRYRAWPPVPAPYDSQPEPQQAQQTSRFAVLSGVRVLRQIKLVPGARRPAVLQWPALAHRPRESRPTS